MNTENQNDNIIDGAISEVKKPDNALVIMDPLKFATELFQPYHDQLASAKRSAARMKYDVATKDGMAKAKELRAAFVTIRTTADKAKTEAKRPIDQSGKLILEHYRKLEEAAKAEEAKHDKAIKDEEARIEAEKQRKLAEERARIEAIEKRIEHLRAIPGQFFDAESEVVKAMLDKLLDTRLDPAKYDEHLEQAVTAQNTAIDALRDLHTKAMDREAEARRIAEERAELARLKAEQEAREKAEKEAEAERQRLARAEQERVEAERRAAAEREAALMRQLEEMKAQMAAQLAAANPPPAVELEPEPEPVCYSQTPEGTKIIGIDLSTMSESAVVIDIHAVQEPMRVEPAPRRPSDDDLIELVMREYGESRKTSLDWLAEINFSAAYDKIA